jgi:imidazolonepropionase
LSTLFTDIGELVTNNAELGDGTEPLGLIANAALLVEAGRVVWVGSAAAAPAADSSVSLRGRAVIPGFVDSHAHLMFAGERSAEFAARMAGESYQAGGIHTTVAATRAASDAELTHNAKSLLSEMALSGITTAEIKSGYGLNTETEIRSVRLAAELTDEVTFLAHVVPKDYAGRADEYVSLITREMLPSASAYASWVDVFCDRGAFDLEQARTILEAGKALGLKPRMHANQLENFGAVQLAVELDCASADHCTHLSDADVEALAASNTVATLVPGAEFSTRSSYPRARDLLAAGATVALATDCNPGSSFTTSMPFVIALAVRELRMTPVEALLAATRGGAQALRRTDIGHLGVGARADFAVLDAPSHIYLSYRPGVPLIAASYRAGEKLAGAL